MTETQAGAAPSGTVTIGGDLPGWATFEVPAIGSTTAHLEQNTSAASPELSDAEFAKLSALV